MQFTESEHDSERLMHVQDLSQALERRHISSLGGNNGKWNKYLYFFFSLLSMPWLKISREMKKELVKKHKPARTSKGRAEEKVRKNLQ